MQKRLKQVILLAAFVPAFAMAQTSAPIDPAMRAAIKDLLDVTDASKFVTMIGENMQAQAKQAVQPILQQELVNNKTLTNARKQAIVPTLRDVAVPRMESSAGQVFTTEQFRQDATQAQYAAYAKYYSIEDIKKLTAFYHSPIGQKFMQVQDRVGHDALDPVLQKYGQLSFDTLKTQADHEIAAAARK